MSTNKLTILNKGLLPGDNTRDDFRAIFGTWHQEGKQNPYYAKKENNIKKIEINSVVPDEAAAQSVAGSWQKQNLPDFDDRRKAEQRYIIQSSGREHPFYTFVEAFEIGYPDESAWYDI